MSENYTILIRGIKSQISTLLSFFFKTSAMIELPSYKNKLLAQ